MPLVLSDGGPVMTLVRSTVERLLVAELDPSDPVAVRRLADVLTRLLSSYALSAPDDPPELVAAAIASLVTRGIGAPAGGPAVGAR